HGGKPQAGQLELRSLRIRRVTVPLALGVEHDGGSQIVLERVDRAMDGRLGTIQLLLQLIQGDGCSPARQNRVQAKDAVEFVHGALRYPPTPRKRKSPDSRRRLMADGARETRPRSSRSHRAAPSWRNAPYPGHALPPVAHRAGRQARPVS